MATFAHKAETAPVPRQTSRGDVPIEPRRPASVARKCIVLCQPV